MNVVIVSLRGSVLSIGRLGLFVVSVVAGFFLVVGCCIVTWADLRVWIDLGVLRILLFVANSVACVFSCYELYLGFLNLWRVVVCCDLGI